MATYYYQPTDPKLAMISNRGSQVLQKVNKRAGKPPVLSPIKELETPRSPKEVVDDYVKDAGQVPPPHPPRYSPQIPRATREQQVADVVQGYLDKSGLEMSLPVRGHKDPSLAGQCPCCMDRNKEALARMRQQPEVLHTSGLQSPDPEHTEHHQPYQFAQSELYRTESPDLRPNHLYNEVEFLRPLPMAQDELDTMYLTHPNVNELMYYSTSGVGPTTRYMDPGEVEGVVEASSRYQLAMEKLDNTLHRI